MLQPIHREITRRALNEIFSPRALAVVISANLGQDALTGQVGHDEYHFDNNAFGRSNAYIESQRSLVAGALGRGEVRAAWKAFGRLTHAAQDFYAHSNYIDLWLSCQPEGMQPPASDIDPLDDDSIRHPALRSGRLYYPLEAFSFVPGLRNLVLPLLPRDSHAWMNLDSPGQGPLFDYAFQAARKRTRREFDLTAQSLSKEMQRMFTDV